MKLHPCAKLTCEIAAVAAAASVAALQRQPSEAMDETEFLPSTAYYACHEKDIRFGDILSAVSCIPGEAKETLDRRYGLS